MQICGELYCKLAFGWFIGFNKLLVAVHTSGKQQWPHGNHYRKLMQMSSDTFFLCVVVSVADLRLELGRGKIQITPLILSLFFYFFFLLVSLSSHNCKDGRKTMPAHDPRRLLRGLTKGDVLCFNLPTVWIDKSL